MLETPLRQAATVLLDSAIRIAPPQAREWGEAMRVELNYVEGSWAATAWALGGAGVMAKQALMSLLIPGRTGDEPGDELFAKHVSLQQVVLAVAAGCVLAALFFFASPPFRQAMHVGLRPWTFLFEAATRDFQPSLQALARRAEAARDPEGMAFCAIRLNDARESARLAEEAVRIDPNLVWAYAVVAMRHPELPEVGAWIDRLESWDAQNGLFHLIRAESIDPRQPPWSITAHPNTEPARAWQSAMAAAFASAKFDDYLDRVAELNRKVVPRYRFYDPYEVLTRDDLDLTNRAREDCEWFGWSLIHNGEEREARNDRAGAREKYWTVARFGEVLDSQAHAPNEHATGTTLQALAYKHLQASAEKAGNPSEAALFGYLATKFGALRQESAGAAGESTFGWTIASRNAAVVEISGFMIVFFSALILVAAAILIAGARPNARPAAKRARPVATTIVASSAVGLLFSSVTLYLTYRPYWYIFQSAILSGERTPARDFREFLMATHLLPGIPPRVLMNALVYSGSPSFLFYVWAGVTLLGVIGLAVILLRHLREHGKKLQPHSRGQ